MRQFLLVEELATEEELRRSSTTFEREVKNAAEEALRAPHPEPETAALYVFSRMSIPSSRFSTEPQTQGKGDTMVAAINATLKDEMANDPRIVVFGQDVADASHESALPLVAGRAVCSRRLTAAARLRQRPRLQFTAGRGEHRRARCWDGAARAQAGRRDPVLRLHLAGIHADSRRAGDDALSLRQPLVVSGGSVPIGGYLRGGARITASRASRSLLTHRASESCCRRTPGRSRLASHSDQM